jgi:23S rRNA pseudouridine1911/1915/1917 synthase
MGGYTGAVEGNFPGELRLDRYAAEHLKILSRSQLKTKILDIKVNGKAVKLSRAVKAGDILELSWDDGPPLYLIPEDLPLDILYEDDHAVVINKAQGMVVHPGAGNRTGTLANALLWRRLRRGGSPESVLSVADYTGAAFRPGIVHRLDKDTSGVIIAAYDEKTLAFLSGQFKNRTAKKIYGAIVLGRPRETEGIIEARIARDSRNRKCFTVTADPVRGRSALTRYRVIRSWGTHSLLLLRPRTGRTHQLRVHLRSLGHPVLGDPLYGGADPRFPGASLMLHARSLSILLPGRDKPDLFRAPLPERFRKIIVRCSPRN